jgi:hypothetical protein
LGVEDGADAWQAVSLTRTPSDPEGKNPPIGPKKPANVASRHVGSVGIQRD